MLFIILTLNLFLYLSRQLKNINETIIPVIYFSNFEFLFVSIKA